MARASYRSIDVAVEQLARRQHGAVSLRQVVDCGGTKTMAFHRVRGNRWEPIRPGVYRLAGWRATWHQALMAACLSLDPGSLASHRSAARLHGLIGAEWAGFEVWSPRKAHRSGVTVRLNPDRSSRDVTTIAGIRATGLVRTLVDLGGVVDADLLERVLEEVMRRPGTDLSRLEAAVERASRSGRAGPARLRAVLDRRSAGPPTESELEIRFLQVLRAAGLALPVRQHEVRLDGPTNVARLDFAYPEDRVGIELDGFAFHSQHEAFVSDRRRQNALVVLGWTVVRFAWEDVVEHADRVLATIRAARRAA